MPESEHVLRLTQELVRLPSYSGHEQQAGDYVYRTLKENGGQPFKQDSNVILHLEGINNSRAFMFNGHLDVVDGRARRDAVHGKGVARPDVGLCHSGGMRAQPRHSACGRRRGR